MDTEIEVRAKLIEANNMIESLQDENQRVRGELAARMRVAENYQKENTALAEEVFSLLNQIINLNRDIDGKKLQIKNQSDIIHKLHLDLRFAREEKSRAELSEAEQVAIKLVKCLVAEIEVANREMIKERVAQAMHSAGDSL